MSDHRPKSKTSALAGTDTATLYTISPEGLHKVVTEGDWNDLADSMWGDSSNDAQDTSPEDAWGEMGQIIREHGGAVFETGSDGAWDVKVHPTGDYGQESERGSSVREKGFLPPYGTPQYGKTAAETAQLEHLSEVIKEYGDALSTAAKTFSWYRRKNLTPDEQDAVLRKLRDKGGELYRLLDIEFENPDDAAPVKKYLRRAKNFRKMVKAVIDAPDWDSLIEVLQSQQTKSKSVWEKFWEYSRELMALIRTLDIEVETTIRAGGFNLVLYRSGLGDWEDATINRLMWVMRQATKLLKKHGLGAAARGPVYCYPTARVPGSSATLAWYRRSDDAMTLAAGSNFFIKQSAQDVLKSVIHELGHRVYYRMLGNVGRRAWERFFEMGKGVPDVGGMINAWERYAGQGFDERDERHRRHFVPYISELRKSDPIEAEWLKIVVQSLGLHRNEKYDSRRGMPTPTSVPALDELEDKAGEVRVFMKPVTAYSATNASELWAEVFAHYILYGPRTIAPVVRQAFRDALPQVRGSKKARVDVLGPELAERFRKDVLALAKSADKVRSLEQIDVLRRAVAKWRKHFEFYLASIRKELEARVREGENPRIPTPEGATRPDAAWAKHYLENAEPVWELLYEIGSRFPEPPVVKDSHGRPWRSPEELHAETVQFWLGRGDSREEAERKADDYARARPPWTREEAEKKALSNWKEEARKWANRVRRKARKAWKFLGDLTEWSQRAVGGRRDMTFTIPEEENVQLEGFTLVFRGFDESPYQDKLPAVKEGLRRYRRAAGKRAPFLLKLRLPIFVEWTFEATTSSSAAAYYENGKVFMTPWVIGKDIDGFVKTLAHEFGHHVHRVVLSNAAQKAWTTFIRQDYRKLDLNEAAQTMRRVGAKTIASDKLAEVDPILYLQLNTLLHAPAYSHMDLFGLDDIEEYLRDGGRPDVSVPAHPITGYGGKNPEEAFCEALGLLVAYGPKAVLGPVRQMLRLVLPGIRTASDKTAKLEEGRIYTAMRPGYDDQGRAIQVGTPLTLTRVEGDTAYAVASGGTSHRFTPAVRFYDAFAYPGDKVAEEQDPAPWDKEASHSEWLRLADDAHARSIALMRFLSGVAGRYNIGEHVYVVGGAVRNFIIDRPIKDIDVVIDAVALGGRKDSDWFAKQVARAIPAATDITTNQYGVAILTVKGHWELDGHDMKGEVIEIANARKESYGGAGGKGYKPSEVEPATIEEDIYRREFTFNTLLWRLMDLTSGPEKAEIIDLTGCGLRDLENRVLRCPRDPDVVFSDDPTRLMRVIKFVAKYGFDIPDDVVSSIRKNAPAMKNAPWEAIATILVQNVLDEPTARDALKLMKRLGLLDVVAEMVQEQKPFATYLSKQLRNRNVQLLLDLMDLGLDVKSPVSFLDRSQQQRLRELTTGMHEDDAQAYLAKLKKPPIDNRALINQFEIPPHERGTLAPTARVLMLDDPSLAESPRALQKAMERELGRQFRRASQDIATDEDWARFAGNHVDQLPGGLADKKQPGDFDQDELAMGVKVEMEHVDDRALAREIAMDHLAEIPDYYTRLKKMEQEAEAKKTAAQTGNGSRVGLFIRIPANLAAQFPEAPGEDSSPRHVTFLVVGEVSPARRDEFLSIVHEVVGMFGSFEAAFDGLDWFPQPEEDTRVFFVRTKFDRDLGALRDKLAGALADAGFEVRNKFPLAYIPHATLSYEDFWDGGYEGPVPDGTWQVTEMEVWGLPQVERIALARQEVVAHVCGLVPRSKTAGVKLLPVHEPLYNLREMAKQMVLLEDHLLHPRKRCMDCIRKHLLTIEALAEEAATLAKPDDDPKWAIAAEMVAEVSRMAQVNIARGEDMVVIGQGWRKTRKTIVQTLYKSDKIIEMIDMTDDEAAEYREDSVARAKTASGPLKLQPGYGTSNAALPRGNEDEEEPKFTWEHLWRTSTQEDWVRLAKGKYKKKKKVDKADGSGKTTVYEYSDRQVSRRNTEKAKRIEKLRKDIDKLRKQVNKDLESDDPTARLSALAVALIDATYARVGNDESAEKGHFGVTGWKVDHVTFKGSKATFEYVGKSGVKQKKTVDDPKIVSALKAATEGKDKDERVLCEGDECTIKASDVNEYLKPFDVTAKDLRGLHANEEMKSQLREIREKNGELPDGKDKKDKLKEEFKKALEATADIVGHEPSTLKSQYLVDSIEDEYLKHGTVPEKLYKKKGSAAVHAVWARYYGEAPGSQIRSAATDVLAHCPQCRSPLHDGPRLFLACSGCSYSVDYARRVERVAHNARWTSLGRDDFRIPALDAQERRWATKSDAEREEDQVEELVKKDPKKKPPRHDLRKQRIKQKDPDLEDNEQDRKDHSMNHKDIGASMVLAKLPRFWEVGQEDDGIIDQDTSPDHPLREFPSDQRQGLHASQADWIRLAEERQPGEVWKSDKGDTFYGKNKDGDTQSFSTPEAAKDYARGKEDQPAEDEEGGDEGGSGSELPDEWSEKYPDLDMELMDDFLSNLDPSMNDKQLLDAFLDSVEEQLPEGEVPEFVADLTPKDFGKLVDQMTGDLRAEHAKEQEREKERAKIKERAKTDPTVLGGESISEDTADTGAVPQQFGKRAKEALSHYSDTSPEVREDAVKKLQDVIAEAKPGSKRLAESKAIMDGIALAAHVAGDDPISGIPSPPPRLRALQKTLVKAGKPELVLDTASDFTDVKARAAISNAVSNMTDDELIEFAKDDPGMKQMSELLLDDTMPETGKRLTRRMMQKFTTMQTAILIPALRETSGKGIEGTSAAERVPPLMTSEDGQAMANAITSHMEEAQDPSTDDDPGIAGALGDMANYLLSKFDKQLSKGKSKYRAVLKAIAGGDAQALEAKYVEADPSEGPEEGTYEHYVQEKKDEGEEPLSKEDWESRAEGETNKTARAWLDQYGLDPWPDF